MVINPNINDYDVKILILLGNQTDNTFKRYQIKLAIINKLFDMERPVFFYINQFIISKGILKEVYAEMITMRMKHYDYYIEEELIDKILKLVSFDTLIYYGADSYSLEFSKKCKEEFDNRAKEIEDKNEMNKKRNLGKVKTKKKGDRKW